VTKNIPHAGAVYFQPNFKQAHIAEDARTVKTAWHLRRETVLTPNSFSVQQQITDFGRKKIQ
jgi:hypothetical protein